MLLILMPLRATAIGATGHGKLIRIPPSRPAAATAMLTMRGSPASTAQAAWPCVLVAFLRAALTAALSEDQRA